MFALCHLRPRLRINIYAENHFLIHEYTYIHISFTFLQKQSTCCFSCKAKIFEFFSPGNWRDSFSAWHRCGCSECMRVKSELLFSLRGNPAVAIVCLAGTEKLFKIVINSTHPGLSVKRCFWRIEEMVGFFSFIIFDRKMAASLHWLFCSWFFCSFFKFLSATLRAFIQFVYN